MKNYRAIKAGNKYIIGNYDENLDLYDVTDGIFGYYKWDTEEEAQEAAEALNEYEGSQWLGQHKEGNDIIDLDDDDCCYSDEMLELYLLFGAVRGEK